MHLKLHTRVGGGRHGMIPFLRFYRTIGVICAPILKQEYLKFAELLKRQYQIDMYIYNRQEYYGETIQEQIENAEIKFDAFLVDDYPHALHFDVGSYPKTQMIAHLEEYLDEKKIILIIAQ